MVGEEKSARSGGGCRGEVRELLNIVCLPQIVLQLGSGLVRILGMLRALLPAVVIAIGCCHAIQAQGTCQLQRLASPPDTPAWKCVGAINTNGRFWFVGDPNAGTAFGGDPLSCSAGADHVYKRSGDQLIRVRSIVPPDVRMGGNFGGSLDADGILTCVDSLNLSQDGDVQADFDGDGALAVFDFLAFETVFGVGCE